MFYIFTSIYIVYICMCIHMCTHTYTHTHFSTLQNVLILFLITFKTDEDMKPKGNYIYV